ncbi:MAG: hypothetical protein OXH99_14945 [Bryobacterales bacterium]|nr:hypothetical protein [Bryobacterales bacterium]
MKISPEPMSGVYTIREYEQFRIGNGLDKRDLEDLKAFAHDIPVAFQEYGHRPVLHFGRSGRLHASNYVGMMTTKRGTVVEILPKIDLGGAVYAGHEQTREAFLRMLRAYRGLNRAANLPPSAIRTLRRFPMLEVFVRLFLENVNLLVRGGLGRRYVAIQENLPFLRGRIAFRHHLRENQIDRSRFYVEHDELSPNRPENRLIRTTLDRLRPIVRNERNRRLLADVEPAFSAVPTARDPRADWRSHCIDRSMQHYGRVMQWVDLFLFNRGLATWSGRHVNQSLLFPMEEVYEDFVTHSFRRHQAEFQVVAQGPPKHMACSGGKRVFRTKPDISLRKPPDSIRFILDAKWKHIGKGGTSPIDDMTSSDLYQLYAYGKRYGCRAVALAYPRSYTFTSPYIVQFFDGLKLVCLPFDVASPESAQNSVWCALRTLEKA